MSRTATLYNKFRLAKDRYRNKQIKIDKEDDKQRQIKAMKDGNGLELRGFSSFDKQSEQIEYAEFVQTEYSFKQAAEKEEVEDKGKEDELDGSLLEISK